jgi:hypothetical protein
MEDEFEIDIGYQDAESVSIIGQAIELFQRKIASGEGRPRRWPLLECVLSNARPVNGVAKASPLGRRDLGCTVGW